LLASCSLVAGLVLLAYGIYSSPRPAAGGGPYTLPFWYEWVLLASSVVVIVGPIFLLVGNKGVAPSTIAWRVSVIIMYVGNSFRLITRVIHPTRAKAIADSCFYAALGAFIAFAAIKVGV
jgi:hypothetical protein